MDHNKLSPTTETFEFLLGGGEMGERIRNFNWSETPLGPVESWPRSLRTCVQIMLTSRQPIWIGWGPELIKLYNDPYKQIVKGKHPWALGKPASAVWKDIWQDIHPMLKKVMHENEGTYVEAQLLIMERNGYPEETYYTFSYTPVAGDNGRTEGMICFNTDDTDRIISERQLKTLTELGKSLTDPQTDVEVFNRAIDILAQNRQDFPFSILYRINGTTATFERSTEFGEDTFEKVPQKIDLMYDAEIPRLCLEATRSHEAQVLHDLILKVGLMPKGAWTVPPDKAIILPIGQRGAKDAYGLLVAGLNPYRVPDQKYVGFFNLIADQISTSLSNVHAMEEERKRLEALAEIDRAKTIFFSNISHEFRTPLTLLLGPIGDIAADTTISAQQREKADVALRNARRMQKLVNMLLDFSRIEAGKMEGVFEAVDIAALTEDLCSTFRSAIEKGGMQLVITKDKIEEPVYVDVDMWEKIILNLLSNAFKYSTSGTITVSIRKAGSQVEVSVADTGAGIEASELERIFDRFHRVQNEHGRSQEGTGIGLAMVKELVRLHNGTIRVKSELGVGSEFTVSIPLRGVSPENINGRLHSNGTGTSSSSSFYVDEAMKWLPSQQQRTTDTERGKEARPVILVADDNADMRLYMDRILSTDYETVLAHDGEAAFEKAVELKPALILSDIMMPRLDGFGLLKKLKNNLATRHIPLIFLSARAGQEARVEGINAGADDYLTKPFSSKELLARIANQIAIAKTRRHTELEFYNMFRQSPAHIHIMKGPDYVLEFFHPLAIPYIGRDLTGLKLREAIPYVEGQGYFEMLDRVYHHGETISLHESKAVLKNAEGNDETYYFNINYLPYRDNDGKIVGILQFSYDITEQVMAKFRLAESEERLRIALEIVELGTWEYDPASDEVFCSERTSEIFGFVQGEKISLESILEKVVTQDRDKARQAVAGAMDPRGDGKYFCEFGIINPITRRSHIVRNIGKVFFDEHGRPSRLIGTSFDITEMVKAEQEVQEREKKFRTLATTIQQIVWIADSEGRLEYLSDQWCEYTGSSPEEGLRNFTEFLHPDDAPIVHRNWQKAFKNDSEWLTEYRLKNINTGQYRWFVGKMVPLRNDQGVIINWIGSASDIQYLKEQSSWLEQQIQDRTQALKELNQSLKLSNEDLQQFAHVASHDLKEPVRKIKTYTNRLREEYLEHLPQQGKGYLDKIIGASDRMNVMIDGVLSYSTYSALEQLFQPVDLGTVVREIEMDLEVLISDKSARIVYDKLPVIMAAPVLIHQLFYNLVNNSLKFSRPGIPPVIEISATTGDNGMARIRIMDNGIGFEAEHADKIFTTFTRLNSKDKYEGTGLGLSLCKKIIQKHRGEIKATGLPGSGSVFEFTLPVR